MFPLVYFEDVILAYLGAQFTFIQSFSNSLRKKGPVAVAKSAIFRVHVPKLRRRIWRGFEVTDLWFVCIQRKSLFTDFLNFKCRSGFDDIQFGDAKSCRFISGRIREIPGGMDV